MKTKSQLRADRLVIRYQITKGRAKRYNRALKRRLSRKGQDSALTNSGLFLVSAGISTAYHPKPFKYPFWIDVKIKEEC